MNNPISKNYYLGSDQTKNKILKFLCSSQIELKTKYERIMEESDLSNIKNDDYIICPKFRGSRTWIIFFHNDENYYAVTFSKNFQRNREKLVIHPIDISVHPSFYQGTIMEGIFYRVDNNHFLVIDEVHILAGENQLLKSRDDRLNNLSNFINKFTQINPYYSMYVTQFFTIKKNSLKDLYQKIKADSKIQEIIFYPRGYKGNIYVYTIMNYDLIDPIVKISHFWLQKTTKPDVYNLLLTQNSNKTDIAYVPDMETSKKCKKWFKNKKSDKLFVKCKMDMDQQKWVPVEIVENNDSAYEKS